MCELVNLIINVLNLLLDSLQFRDLPKVIKKHRDTVKLTLSGHFHKGTFWGMQRIGVPSYTLPSIRYNPQVRRSRMIYIYDI